MRYVMIVLMMGLINCINPDDFKSVVDDYVDEYSDSEDSETYVDEGEGGSNGAGGLAKIGNRPSSADFMGTYQEAITYDQCGMFPQILRLYSDSDYVLFETNGGKLIAEARIFADGTFDFEVDVLNKMGGLASTQSCTCNYYQPAYYAEYFNCLCETTYTNGQLCNSGGCGSCNIEYEIY